jgi:CRISPR-associated endonuclease/helicase Cas3
MGSRLLSFKSLGEVETSTTEDETASATTSRAYPVYLDKHLEGVEQFAERFAQLCGLSDTLRRSLVMAARWHDLGKADDRFQAWLHKGSTFAAEMAERLLAKGLQVSKLERERDRVRSGYPRGGQHELVSVRLSERLMEQEDRPIDRDLVLHLLASHHGRAGRPFAPFIEDSDGIIVSCRRLGLDVQAHSDTRLYRLDSGVAERFWMLTRRYGWWGLAFLESLLRLADQRQSEAEQNAEENNRP